MLVMLPVFRWAVLPLTVSLSLNIKSSLSDLRFLPKSTEDEHELLEAASSVTPFYSFLPNPKLGLYFRLICYLRASGMFIGINEEENRNELRPL